MMPRAPKALPPDFRFGVATADHQCEAYDGHADIRDRWESVRGLTLRGRATDFWTRYPEDVELARRMGCKTFRLSLSWARLEPVSGIWDEGVEQHYRELLACIREAGMSTVVTLQHNTWPVHVQAAGQGAGMLDPEFPARFAAYAAKVAERLGALIDFYVTLNETGQLIFGYIKGWWMRDYPNPPGLEPLASEQVQMGKVLELIPNLFRAHARAREAIRSVHAQAMVGSNPLVLGLPRWLRWFVDTWATRVTEPNLRLQAKALSKAQVLAAARVDISIAQLTLTTDRMAEALFSESYFVAHLSALHSSGVSLPASFAGWTGSVGVTDGSAPAAQAGSYFPHATIRTYPNVEAAIAALAKKAVALVFDDDVILRPYSGPDLELDTIEGPEQPFAIAMALGSRSLLNAVDSALRNFKRRDANGLSRWDASMSAAFPGPHGDPPDLNNRKTLANIGRSSVALPAASAISGMDGSLDAIRRRGVLRVGIHCEVPGLCIEDDGRYVGLEPDVAYYIAGQIFDTPNPKVEFVTLHEDERLTASRSPLWFLDPLRKLFSMLTTVAAANWWNLGMAGKLPKFLCPPECIGTLDFVGLDYYWGFNSIAGALRLPAALECRYASAPVWPRGLYNLLISEYRRFPGKPLMVIENGCVPVADNVSRPDYLTQHIRELERAAEKGVPVRAYLCWSITSNREWGLPFDGNSDFGLYHIELDSDPLLTRMLAPGRDQYAQIIQRRSAL